MKKLKKAIIPAAGLGTRFLPITKAVPKPMLSVLDKPTIQYIAEELISVGIEDIVIVVSPDSGVIEKHFGECDALEQRLLSDGKQKLYEIAKDTHRFNVKFVVQHEANGLAGAILCAEPFVKDEPFALLLGDELLVAKEGQTPCIMQVNAILEKPSINEALSNNAIIGRYVLSGEVMGMLKTLKPHGNEIYLTDVLDSLAKDKKLLASTITDDRYDVGDKCGYIKANVEMALKSKEIGQEVKEYIKELAKSL